MTSTDIDLGLSLNDNNRLKILPSCTSYILPEGFTIDETKRDHKENLFVSNDLISRDCITNDNESFSKNVIGYVRKFSTKINFKINNTEYSHEDLSFMQYLQKKIFNLYNTYNDCTRKLVKRMDSMIKHGVNSTIRFNLIIYT